MTEKEKKKRIEELRGELKTLQAVPKSDWHMAFEAFLKLQTYKYEGVVVQTEVEIGTEPPRADFIVLRNNDGVEFEESIFKIFRRINIIEYKNPDDSLNERVLLKTLGYAYLLMGTAVHEGDIPKDQVTITIFRAVKNTKLFSSLKKEGKLIKTRTPGIYHIAGVTDLPFQIVITSELEGAEYAACRALTNKASEDDIEQVIDLASYTDNEALRNYYRIVLYLLAEKNYERFSQIRRRKDMNKDALLRIMKDDIEEILDERMKQERQDANERLQQERQDANERLQQERQDANERLQQERQDANERLQQERQDANERLQQERLSAEKDLQQTSANYIKSVMEALDVTIEKAMEVLKIPQNEKGLYSGLIQKK